MKVDKDLFLYDLAIVAIMKNESPYVKEWIDYHLAAGVDHFFIYDNESPDNFKEVLQPYIDAGIVTYIFYPGTGRQVEAYIEAFKTYRFFCRYMAFIDADEFIFPQSKKSIVEVVDKIFSDKPDANGLEVHWMMYGSNNLETADYSKGVLERFTSRAEKISHPAKTITNPRKIDYLHTPHFPIYFDCTKNILEKDLGENRKIIINHYRLKSREEFTRKYNLGCQDASYGGNEYYNADKFTHEKNNDVFDDSILKYFNRQKISGKTIRQIDYEKLVNALIKNLAPILAGKVPEGFFEGKMENFLTCRALSTYLKENVIGEERGALVENASLSAIYFTILTPLSLSDIKLLLNELPNILSMNYPAVENIRKGCLEILSKLKSNIRLGINSQEKMMFWRDFNEFDNLFRILKSLENHNK